MPEQSNSDGELCCDVGSLSLEHTDGRLREIIRHQEWKEYEFHPGPPQSLPELMDVRTNNGSLADIVWLTDNAFLCNHCDTARFKELAEEIQLFSYLTIRLRRSRNADNVNSSPSPPASSLLSVVIGLSLQNVWDALEFLLELAPPCYDHHFYGWDFDNVSTSAGNYVPSPFPSHFLIKILSTTIIKEHGFSNMVFSAEAARILITYCRMQTHIILENCVFVDEGLAFVQALLEHENAGPDQLTIRRNFPLSASSFAQLWTIFKSNVVSLDGFETRLVNRTLDGHVVIATNLNFAALKSHLRDGRGLCLYRIRAAAGGGSSPSTSLPTLYFDEPTCLFVNAENFMVLFDALRNNTHLTSLEVNCRLPSDLLVLHALPRALLKARELSNFRLVIDDCFLENPEVKPSCVDTCLVELFTAISTHPTLRSVAFVPGYLYKVNTERVTRAVVDMLKINQQIVDVGNFHNQIFYWEEWNNLVTPRIQGNRHRILFKALRNTNQPIETQAMVMGKALARVNGDPFLTWLLLSLNVDILTTYMERHLEIIGLEQVKRIGKLGAGRMITRR